MLHLHQATHTIHMCIQYEVIHCSNTCSYTSGNELLKVRKHCFSVTFANNEKWSLRLFQHRDSFGDLVIAGQAYWRRRTTGRKPEVTQSQELKLDIMCLNDLSVKLNYCFTLVRVLWIWRQRYTLHYFTSYGNFSMANSITVMYWEYKTKTKEPKGKTNICEMPRRQYPELKIEQRNCNWVSISVHIWVFFLSACVLLAFFPMRRGGMWLHTAASNSV